MGRFLAAMACVLLAGCAAQTMRGYIGQNIRNVELEYGPAAAPSRLDSSASYGHSYEGSSGPPRPS